MTAAVTETHTSTLFFVEDRVYKRKRPLDLGFSDFRTRATRQAACHAEVALNRRLSPDVYLGVADVHDPEGQLCEHLVVMRRMPDERRLATLVLEGADVTGVLEQVARELAALHLRSPAPTRLLDVGGLESLRQQWTTGLDALAAYADLVPESVREQTRRLALRWLAGRSDLLQARIDGHHLVDGHGDLLADDIFALDDGPRILDCLEFDERLRIGDGLADAAFLAMDLEWLGAPAAARAFLEAYEREMVDTPPPTLEHFYVALRAHVRSKVACIRAGQQPSIETRARARGLADLAVEHLLQGQVRLVLVGGLPGSGKTTLATALAGRPGWLHLSSDAIRKELFDVVPDEHRREGFAEGRYAPQLSAQTYQAMRTRARTALELGYSVVLDASFIRAADRQEARAVGHAAYADVIEIQCRVTRHVAETRIRGRSSSLSDATPTILDAMTEIAESWPQSTVLDTDCSTTSTLRAATALLDSDPVSSGPGGVRS